MDKDYKNLYLKYKNKYINAKKNVKGGTQSFDSKSDPFGVSALTIESGVETSNDSISVPLNQSKEETFEEILNHRIEGNKYVSEQKPIKFIFEKINFIRCEENKFVTLFTSKIPSGYRYYFKIGDLEKNVDYKEIIPLDVNKPTIYHEETPEGPGEITYENRDSMLRKKIFIDRKEIIVGNQKIYLFVNRNYGLFYFIDKDPDFIVKEYSTEKMESELLIDNKGPNNEQLEDPILKRRQEILNSQKKID